jgi:ABC-type branched-subunit amino acid transport system ATPase component
LPLLSVEDLVSGYGKMAIIQGVTLAVNERDFVAVVGPNGSGKSTLVKTIFGLTTLFEGKIIFDGVDITRKTPELISNLKLGYVPQVSNTFSEMSVMENLEMGASTIRSSEKRKDILTRVTSLFPILKSREKQRAGLLSGGERQMLAVGRALMGEPKLLILDEPTAALAPIVAEQLFQSLKEIQTKFGITIILVEQNARKALALANNGIVLIQGKKAFEGPPDRILSDSDIIRLFLGELTI